MSLYTIHSRLFRENRFVYPVLSRRSKGISIGINLNPDKICNFNCIYCQVDRRSRESLFVEDIDIGCIVKEVEEVLKISLSGELFSTPPFDKVPYDLQHISDIAFSGDGEPTTFPEFYELVEEIIPIRNKYDLSHRVKLILITNSSCINRPWVEDAIDLLYKNNGEVWTKLDAGSEEYFRGVSRSRISFRHIIHNIISLGRRHPIVIQSCFNRVGESPPPEEEIEKYCDRLKEITDEGGTIRLVQIYTIARPPAEEYVSPLSEDELEAIACKVKKTTRLETEVFP